MNEQASISMQVGKNIRRWRKQQAMTQTELSQKIGMTQGYFSKLERGDKSPNLRLLSRIAAVTGMSVRDMMSDA